MKIKTWKYLNTITAEITQYDDMEVSMLIGFNCRKALEALKKIAN